MAQLSQREIGNGRRPPTRLGKMPLVLAKNKNASKDAGAREYKT